MVDELEEHRKTFASRVADDPFRGGWAPVGGGGGAASTGQWSLANAVASNVYTPATSYTASSIISR